MTTAPFHHSRLIIEPLSPIHIGSGNTIEPYEYTLTEQNGNGWLEVIDLDALLTGMSPRQRAEFDTVINRGDFPGVRAWLRKQIRSDQHVRYRIPVQPGPFDELRANQENPDRLGEIHLSTRTADSGRPYIPGSSIKGALRTAIVDDAARHGNKRELQAAFNTLAGGNRQVRSSALFEAHALGHTRRDKNTGRERADLYSDPLRQIAIADAPLPEDGCYIDQVNIVQPVEGQRRAGAPDPGGILMYRDLTWSVLDGENLHATTELRWYHQLPQAQHRGEPVLPRTIDLDHLLRACNDYYVPEIERQLDLFTPRSEKNDRDIRDPLVNAANSLQSNQCIIRLGRHSHYECMVLSRPYNTFGNRGGKSRTYADGRLPLGWARLTFHQESRA